MNTNKLLTRFVSMGTRLTILLSMLMAAFMVNVTPAAAAVNGITIGAQSGTLTYASSAGSATYSVTVTRSSGFPSSFTLNITGLPAGVSFSPSGATSFSGNPSRTVTLTLTKTASLSIAAGTYPFVIRASTGIGAPSANGSLVVSRAGQTITFGSLANKTTSSPDFNVSASGGASGNPVTFSATPPASCTISGTLVHIVGAGSCAITASQAGNTNYDPAPNVIRSFSIAAAGPTTTIDLCATAGTATMPGGVNVPIWGYVLGDCSGSPVASLPGPQLTVNQDETVVLTLHNNLTESTSLLFQGQEMIPDTNGVVPGGAQSYTFTASRPGTFLYEAGLRPNSQHQVAMGMYGALVVRPTGAPLQAYGSSSTAFDAEQVVVLSELDTTLNTSATPASFDMRSFAPQYFLINGNAYPNTANLSATAGNKVLLRYVNAGLQAHAMSLLGFSQTVIAQDGSPFALAHKMASETMAPGQTLDTIVNIPASVADGSKFALYDANMLLRNNTGTGANAGLGGMLTLLAVGNLTSGTDTFGPLLSSITLSPNPSTGAVSVALSFNANDTTTGNSNVTAAEYWIDAGAHTPITVGSPAPVVALNATISAATMAGLTAGTHVVSLRAQDALGNWSTTGTINLIKDNAGPTTSGLALNPNPSNGLVSVNLSFTADDSATGNLNIDAAEYFIDPAGTPAPGTGTSVAVGTPAPVKTLNATIPAQGSGSHVIAVRARDAVGNWGALTSTTLVIDNTGPSTTSVSAAPDPNNGTLGLSTSVQAVRVSASFSDASSGGSNLTNAEGFLDTPGTFGTGFVFVANDGNFNSPAEPGFADIPLVVVNALTNGLHPICIHARDAAGNWGTMNCGYSLTIDRTPPTVVSINRIGANPTGATSVQWQVTFSEAVTGVAASNFATVRTGLSGTSSITAVTGGGTTWTVTATTGTGSGTIGLNLTSPTGIADLASNAMTSTGLPFVGQIFTIALPPQPSIYFSTFGNTNPQGAGGSADDADIYFYPGSGSNFTRVIDASAAPYNLPSGANVDGFDRVDATHFYMSFNSTVSVPGIGNVQDEDVVFYNAGTWSVYFDGTPSSRGLSGTDVDAISVVGGILYFSTSDSTQPFGVTGGGDDADIYSWNGTSFARVVNANGTGSLGLPSGANVDGFVRVDPTHFYMSFDGSVTLPGGAGTAQDEDVVYYNAGTWSIYFDGSVLGLDSSGNLDIDAFDLP